MKSPIFRFLLTALLLGASQAFAALSSQAPEGWVFNNLPEGSFVQKVTGNADAIFSKPGENDPTKVSPTVRVYTFPRVDTQTLISDSAWRSAIFGEAARKFSIVNEKILTTSEGKRYFIEYQSDRGSESMLQSAALGMIVKGQLVVLIYEQRQVFYRKQIEDVKSLFARVKFN